MSTSQLILGFAAGVLLLSLLAYVLGRRRALSVAGGERALHSRSGFYGWYAVVLMASPAIGVALLAALLDLLGWVRAPVPLVLAAALALAAGGLWGSLWTIRPGLRARNIVEGVARWLLFTAALISILTTLGILLSILFEAIRFFQMEDFWYFITGTTWSPDSAFLGGAGRGMEEASDAQFGSVPLFAGTFMITAIAMAVALPVGLLSAIFLSEYASQRVRGALKPALEVLAGIPTVVYGFFAAVTVAPLVVNVAQGLGLSASYENALTPGIVMGIMIIPFVSSLSDDVISSIPMSMREGSYALGATTSETIKHVLLSAALPGVVSAFILGVSRALGETMIVVMAAGLRPNLTANPLDSMTTVTVHIVDLLTGDQEFDSAITLSAFALGLVLFVVTLVLNTAALKIVRRFHEKYE
ncbi:MAG: phosphate ABC transporter permease subunit PstC [Halorhodospira sp.]